MEVSNEMYRCVGAQARKQFELYLNTVMMAFNLLLQDENEGKSTLLNFSCNPVEENQHKKKKCSVDHN